MIVFFALLIIFLSGVIVYKYYENKRRREVWEVVAARQNLGYRKGDFLIGGDAIYGTLDGVSVEIDLFTESLGRDKTDYTRYVAKLDSAPQFALNIVEEGFFFALTKALGAQDIEVGDEFFDNNYLIKGDDPPAIVKYLDETRKKAIVQVFEQFSNVEITDRRVVAMNIGQELNADILQSRVGLVVACAKILNVALNSEERFELSKQLPRGLDDIDMEEEKYGAEYWKAEPSVGQETNTELILPDDEMEPTPSVEVKTEVEEGSEKGKGTAPNTTSEQPKPALENAESGLLVCEVCEEVFSAEMSLSSEDTSSLRFIDQKVDWSGVLVSVQRLSYDFVFKDMSGTRAVVKVHEIASSLGIKNEIRAVVQLPTEDYETLKDAMNKKCRFTGTIFQFNPMLKEIYLVNGTLIINPEH